MGNNHSHEGTPRNGISRNNSGADLQEKAPTQLLPIDKLAKVSVFMITVFVSGNIVDFKGFTPVFDDCKENVYIFY